LECVKIRICFSRMHIAGAIRACVISQPSASPSWVGEGGNNMLHVASTCKLFGDILCAEHVKNKAQNFIHIKG
jgi:hypothetical protein